MDLQLNFRVPTVWEEYFGLLTDQVIVYSFVAMKRIC